MKKTKKQSLLQRLMASNPALDRARAEALILAGRVWADGERVDKPGSLVKEDAAIEIEEGKPYVSRGGLKMAGALDAFGVDVAGRVCADIGASTGGFTDVLLRRGAAKVYAIDVGYGELDWRLRQDPRVVVMERTNARLLDALPEPVGFICADVSFISLRAVLAKGIGWLSPEGEAVVLLKPQFEASRAEVEEGGIVRSTEVHRRVIEDFVAWCRDSGLFVRDVTASPIRGGDGNKEFLLSLSCCEPGNGEQYVCERIEQSLRQSP